MAGLLDLIPVVGPILSGIIGNQQQQGARNAQEEQQRAALAALQSIQLPDVEKQKLLLELPQLIGQYNPQLQQTYQLNPSAMEGVSTDPQLAQAQLAALQSMTDLGKTGMTADETAQLHQMRRQVSQQDQANQNAILQNMAQRGVGGSGVELAARLKASQTAADRASQESDRIAAMAQQRALQAIAQAGQLGGQIRGQEFGEKSDIAKSKDLFQQFNVKNQQDIAGQNVNTQNQAQMANLNAAQNIANQQNQLKNQQQSYNKSLIQTQFENELNKAGKTNVERANLGKLYGNDASRTGNLFGEIGTGISKGVAGIIEGNNTAADEAKKKISQTNEAIGNAPSAPNANYYNQQDIDDMEKKMRMS